MAVKLFLLVARSRETVDLSLEALQGLVDAHEIVVHEVDRHHVVVVQANNINPY